MLNVLISGKKYQWFMGMWFYFILSVMMWKVSSSQEKLIYVLKNEIESLDDVIRLSLHSGLNLVEKLMKELEEKTSEIRSEAINLIEEHSFNTLENLGVYTAALSVSEKNGTRCSDGLERVISDTQDKTTSKLKTTVASVKIQNLVAKSVPIILKLQNKTFEITEMAQGCVYFRDDDCMEKVVERVENLKEVTPPLIQTVIDRLEMQMKIVETELVSEVQKTVNSVVEEHNDILFGFIQCII